MPFKELCLFQTTFLFSSLQMLKLDAEVIELVLKRFDGGTNSRKGQQLFDQNRQNVQFSDYTRVTQYKLA